MSMQELFYGEMEPSYLVHYRHPITSVPCSQSYVGVPQIPPRATLDFTVPMCCTRCADAVRDALILNDAILCPRSSSSSYTTHRHQCRPSPSLGSHRARQHSADHRNLRASCDSSYCRSHCPTYRPSAGTTHYVSVGQRDFATPTHWVHGSVIMPVPESVVSLYRDCVTWAPTWSERRLKFWLSIYW